MKLSISRVLRRSIMTLLCLSILTSSSVAFASTKTNGAASIQAQSAASTTSATSVNWSGYAATKHSFTKVQGDITVPTVTCTTAGAESLFWVGLDGYSDSTVEQDGVGAKCVNGAPQYFAWWEMFNGAGGTTLHTVSTLSVKPGDKVAAIVTYNGGVQGFLLQLDNTSTSQKTFSTTQHCDTVAGACTRQSAEWIAENYTGPDNRTPLAKWGYNSSLFTYAKASTSASYGLDPISYYNNIAIDMISAKTDWHYLDNVNSLGNGGTSFGVTWKSAK
jgi:hypothetical protein